MNKSGGLKDHSIVHRPVPVMVALDVHSQPTCSPFKAAKNSSSTVPELHNEVHIQARNTGLLA